MILSKTIFSFKLFLLIPYIYFYENFELIIIEFKEIKNSKKIVKDSAVFILKNILNPKDIKDIILKEYKIKKDNFILIGLEDISEWISFTNYKVGFD